MTGNVVGTRITCQLVQAFVDVNDFVLMDPKKMKILSLVLWVKKGGFSIDISTLKLLKVNEVK